MVEVDDREAVAERDEHPARDPPSAPRRRPWPGARSRGPCPWRGRTRAARSRRCRPTAAAACARPSAGPRRGRRRRAGAARRFPDRPCPAVYREPLGCSLTAWPLSSPRRSPRATSRRRAAAGGHAARRTPTLSTRTISERAGGTVVLKAENLQSTGSFKVRGTGGQARRAGRGGLRQGRRRAPRRATTRRRWPPPRARWACPCEVFVPADAPIAKAEAARGQGAIVHLGGAGVEDCLDVRDGASARGRARVRPPVRRSGRSSRDRARSVSSCSRTCPTSRKVVIPVGGGGLCSGVAIAIKSARPGGRGGRRPDRRRLTDDRRRDRGQDAG